jgi:dUTP pyrophosphatase
MLYIYITSEFTNNKTLLSHYRDNRKNYVDDSGLDLVCPETISFSPGETKKLYFGIDIFSDEKYNIYPRSSIFKTPLRMVSDEFLINPYHNKDNMGVYVLFKNISNNDYTINEGDRLAQLCLKSLEPIQYKLLHLHLKILHPELKEHYNNNYKTNLIAPQEYIINPGEQCKIKLGISAESASNFGYYLEFNDNDHPLILTNIHGIIDKQYRGEIMAIVENVSSDTFTINKFSPFFKLTGPYHYPLTYELRDELSETDRGEKGFGSTGQ